MDSALAFDKRDGICTGRGSESSQKVARAHREVALWDSLVMALSV